MPRKKKEETTKEPEEKEVQDLEPQKETKRRKKPTSKGMPVVISEESELENDSIQETYFWMELQNSLKSKRILYGNLEGIEKSVDGMPIAIVYYKGKRVVIPASEMMIDINEYSDQSQKELHNRYSQILSRMMGAEVDFIVSGADKASGSVVASRKAAMLKKRQQYFLPNLDGEVRISEGKKVEARVIAVGDKILRLEIFGVEATISAKEIAWEWVEDIRDYYHVGQHIFVKIKEIQADKIDDIRIVASIKDATKNTALENIQKCTVQGKYIGKVTGIDKSIIYVRLNIGVNAFALAIHDSKMPRKHDEVSFVITRIDAEKGIAIGIITKVLKTFI